MSCEAWGMLWPASHERSDAETTPLMSTAPCLVPSLASLALANKIVTAEMMIQMAAHNATTLTSLDIHGQRDPMPGLVNSLRCLVNLRRLTLAYNKSLLLDAEACAVLGSLLQLESLTLVWASIVDQSSSKTQQLGDFAFLAQLPTLHTFDFRSPVESNLTARSAWGSIGRCAGLRHLVFADLQRFVDVARLQQNLRSVSLVVRDVSVAFLTALFALPAIDTVRLLCARRSLIEGWCPSLPGSGSLTTLAVANTELSFDAMAAIAALPKLRSLHAVHTGSASYPGLLDGAVRAGGCPHLEELHVNDNASGGCEHWESAVQFWDMCPGLKTLSAMRPWSSDDASVRAFLERRPLLQDVCFAAQSHDFDVRVNQSLPDLGVTPFMTSERKT